MIIADLIYLESVDQDTKLMGGISLDSWRVLNINMINMRQLALSQATASAESGNATAIAASGNSAINWQTIVPQNISA